MTDARRDELPAFISRDVRDSSYYFLELDPAPQSRLTVVCGGWEVCTRDYEISRRDFPYFAIECIADGRGEVTLNGSSCELEPGMVFHYGSNIPHRIKTDPQAPLEKYYVDFVGTRARELLNQSPFAHFQPLRFGNPEQLYTLFGEIHQAALSPSSVAREVCSASVELLLLKLLHRATLASEVDSAARQTYDMCRAFIVSHAKQLQNLGEISQHCGVSKAYLCRLFRRFSQETPYRLLIQTKMHEAAGLLGHTQLLTKTIAHRVGFMDPYHFSRVFKQVYGHSPAAFRQRYARNASETDR